MMPWAGENGGGDSDELGALSSRLVDVEDALVSVPASIHRVDAAQADVRARLDAMHNALSAHQAATRELLIVASRGWERRLRQVATLATAAIIFAIIAVAAAFFA
jgi:hypothetical protein